MRYDVVLVGYRLNASVKAAQALQKVLGLDIETCRQLARQFPATVLSAVTKAQAEHVAAELTECGGKVEVRESRISHASDASQLGPSSIVPMKPANEQGGYEIGEILAPLKRGSLAPKSGKPSDPAPKRPSREELDEALKDSFRPLRNETPQAEPPHRSISVPPPSLELELDGAFAGMKSFDESFGGLTTETAPLQVEEKALRSIQRSPSRAPKAKPPETAWQRFMKKLRGLSSSTLELVTGALWLVVVSALSAAAVGYALDPSNVLGAIGLGDYNDRAKQLLDQVQTR